MEQGTLWDQLPLLMRANSKDSLESILQTLWRTRRTGVDAAARSTICDTLQLDNDSDLDPLLLCLRMLMRRCVYDKISKDEIQTLFPDEGKVLPEIQRLLTLLLQKFQSEWREDVLKEQATLPRLKAMTWDMERSNTNSPEEPLAVINLKLQNEVKFHFGETELEFQVDKDTIEATLQSMYSMRDQFSDGDEQSNRHLSQENTL